MDEAQERKADAREALGKRDLGKLTAAALALGGLTQREIAFWDKTNLAGIQKLAAVNRAQATEFLHAAQEMKRDTAATVFAQLEKTCASRHDLHPEKQL